MMKFSSKDGSAIATVLIISGVIATTAAYVSSRVTTSFQATADSRLRVDKRAIQEQIFNSIDCQSTLGLNVNNGSLSQCSPSGRYVQLMGRDGKRIGGAKGSGDLANAYALYNDWYVQASCRSGGSGGLTISLAKATGNVFALNPLTKQPINFARNVIFERDANSVSVRTICGDYFPYDPPSNAKCGEDGLVVGYDPQVSPEKGALCTQVQNAHIASTEVLTGHVKNGQVLSADIGGNSIGPNQIVDGTIYARHVPSLQIGTGHIDSNPRAVRTEHIFNATVLSRHIAPNQIHGYHLVDQAIGSGNIVDYSITSNQIKNSEINTNHIVNGSINQNNIGDDAVGPGHITNGTVIYDDIAPGTIDTSNVVDGSLNSQDIADGAVNGDGRDHMASGAVIQGKVASRTVVGSHIATGAITSNELVDRGIHFDRFKVTGCSPGSPLVFKNGQWGCSLGGQKQIEVATATAFVETDTGSDKRILRNLVYSNNTYANIFEYQQLNGNLDVIGCEKGAADGWRLMSCIHKDDIRLDSTHIPNFLDRETGVISNAQKCVTNDLNQAAGPESQHAFYELTIVCARYR